MIKLSNLINESNSVHEYGCAMIYYTVPKFNKITTLIDEADVYTEDGDNTYGVETEPHVTLLYGIHSNIKPSIVLSIISDYDFRSNMFVLKNPSLFQNEKYDVLKYEAQADYLYGINRKLTKLPHTSSFPNYNPHLTIAYLKSGTGEKYVNLINSNNLDTINASIKYAVYSHPSGSKTKLKINTIK